MKVKEKKKLEQLASDLNKLIIKYHGFVEVEEARDDLCNIRWILENRSREASYDPITKKLSYED